MPTFLFDDIIFGPVKSRRLGSSLGINLLPTDCKVCSFDCIYCECGWTSASGLDRDEFPGRMSIAKALTDKLKSMAIAGSLPDTITYAGNGEPTLHPEFEHIISDTVTIRDEYSGNSKIAVLSNASFSPDDRIIKALNQIELNILKLDTGIEKTFYQLNQPEAGLNLDDIINNLKRFEGNLIIQTMLVRGSYNVTQINNSTPEELQALIKLYEKIRPKAVMVYTYERDTAATGLEKVSLQELKDFSRRIEDLGIETVVSF